MKPMMDIGKNFFLAGQLLPFTMTGVNVASAMAMMSGLQMLTTWGQWSLFYQMQYLRSYELLRTGSLPAELMDQKGGRP